MRGVRILVLTCVLYVLALASTFCVGESAFSPLPLP